MSSNTIRDTAAPAATRTPTITQFFPRLRLAKYIEQFKKDPMTFLNDRLMKDECEWVPTYFGYVLAQKRHSEAEETKPAEIRIIGEISRTHYWLYACGGWHGSFGEPIETAKATGRLRSGRTPEVEGMWTRFVETLDEVILSRGVPTFARHSPLMNRGELKIRHKIFEPSSFYAPSVITPPSSGRMDCVRTGTDGNNVAPAHIDENVQPSQDDKNYGLEDIGEQLEMLSAPVASDGSTFVVDAEDVVNNFELSELMSELRDSEIMKDGDVAVGAGGDEVLTGPIESEDDLPPAFDMKNWPCGSSYIKSHLDRLIDSGKFVGLPLPVFDINGDRVPPAEHEERLKGALVDVSLKIVNVTYEQYSFFADITSIVILAPPGYEPTVEDAVIRKRPKKYRTPSHLKAYASPTVFE